MKPRKGLTARCLWWLQVGLSEPPTLRRQHRTRVSRLLGIKKLKKFHRLTGSPLKTGRILLYTNEAMTENLEKYSKLGYVETERKQ